MRIDRQAFFAAVAALSGCQQDRSQLHDQPMPEIHLPRPTAAVVATHVLPPEPVRPLPVPPPAPPPVAQHRQTPKQWFHGLTLSQRKKVTSSCEDFLERQCQASLQRILPKAPTERQIEIDIAKIEPQPIPTLATEQVKAYCKADFPPPSCETPLVVAFENQPVEFAPAAGERFAFVPGAPKTSDWLTVTTPWIALDLDGDGTITSGAELFGSSTVLPGGGRAENGFIALAALDANGDGVLDASDPMFGKLVLWTDRDGDHQSSPGELRPLASVVTRISLAFTRDARCNARDDCEGEHGTLHWSDATGANHTGTVVDVYLPTK